MIHEVDESLRSFVRQEALPDNGVDVVFDAPTKDWAGRRNAPTVDLYLYDIREDMGRRQSGQSVRRDADGLGIARDQPPRWFKLSYLVTAWTQRPEDEHRLLSLLLQCFLTRDALPSESLSGSLVELGAVISYTCALPPPQDRALSDVWSALGGELKPSLDLVVTAPFDLTQEIPIGPPVTEPLGLGVTDLTGGPAAAHDPTRFERATNGNSNGHGAKNPSERNPGRGAGSKARPKKQKPTRSTTGKQ